MREGEPKGFLEEKYPDLPKSEEVASAVRRQDRRGGEKVKPQPKEKIEAYLDRLDEVFNPKDPEKRERRVGILKDKLHKLFVIKSEDIPESYFEHQKRIAREQGHGDIEITDEMRKQMADTIIHDQTQSLDVWVDYLGSEDATYPNWLKYFAFRSVTKLSEYDKEKKEFKKRSKGTTAPFPDINREALAYVLDSIEKSHKKEAKDGATDERWGKLLKTANFGKLYAHAIEKITPASQEEKENVQGEWVKYDQGSDAEPLYKSLQGHGTGWCTAGEGVARKQLEAGDFYVFYSNDKKGSNSIPRVAIRMQSGEIAEIRGINADQNLEPSMMEAAKEKMKGLPGAEKYEKRVADMRRLTEIESRFKKMSEIIERGINEEISAREQGRGDVEDGQADKAEESLEKLELTRDELRFLYEVDGQIDGFGYQKDPRIEKLRELRDIVEDLSIIFGCQPNQVALGKNQIRQDTVVYNGEWTPEVLSLLPEGVEHVYERFPDKKPFRRIIKSDDSVRSVDDAKTILRREGWEINASAEGLLGRLLEESAFLNEKQGYEAVIFSARSFGLPEGAEYGDMIMKARELGLDFLPTELVPQLRLQYKDQKNDETFTVAREPIAGSKEAMSMFLLGADTGGGPRVGLDACQAGYPISLDKLYLFVRVLKPAKK